MSIGYAFSIYNGVFTPFTVENFKYGDIFYTIMEKNAKQFTVVNGSHIICPLCKEKIAPADIEAYRQCPYCGHVFEQTPEFEDFVLSPLTRQWVKNTINQFLR